MCRQVAAASTKAIGGGAGDLSSRRTSHSPQGTRAGDIKCIQNYAHILRGNTHQVVVLVVAIDKFKFSSSEL